MYRQLYVCVFFSLLFGGVGGEGCVCVGWGEGESGPLWRQARSRILEQGRGGWAYMSMWRMRSEYLRRVREGMGRINLAMRIDMLHMNDG